MQRSSTKALSPASCLLACVLEVEVAGGRDPNTFVASFAKVLEADDSVGATSVLVKAQPTPRGRRAVEALFATLQQPTQPNDDPAPPLQPAQLKREALVRGLSAVDALSDFVAVASKGKPRALMALGSAARAGRAWTSVRESAEEIPQLPSQLPGLLGTVSGGELVDVSGLEQPGVRKALTRLFTALGLHVERSLTHDKGNGSEVATGFGLSSAPERKEEAALLRRSVDLLADTLSHADACGFPLVASIDNAAEEEIAGRGKLLAAAQAGSTAKAGSSSSSSSSSQSPPAEPRAPRGPMRGPAMPEPAALAAAAAASAEPYSVLGLTVGASEEDVRQAYKKLARRLHPDRLIRASPEEKQAAELSFEAVKAAHLFLLNVGPSAPDSHGPRGVAEDDYSDGDDSIDDEHDGRDGPTVQLMTTKSEKEAQDWGPLSCLSTSGKGHGANVDSSRGGAGCQGCQGGGSGGRSSSELAASKKRARDKEWELVRGGLSAMEAHVVAAAEEEKVVSASHQGGREEWMLVAPVDEGDGGFLSGLKKESNPTARGFQQMIPHSRQYAGLDDKEEAESSDAQKRAQNDPELEARIAEHKAARGPSLVEQYQLNSAKQGGGKKKPSGRGAGKTREEAEKDLWGGKGERDANSGEGGGSGFSIDEIMGGSGSVGGSKVSQHELGGMIADAKALDSRFSRQVTKNFM